MIAAQIPIRVSPVVLYGAKFLVMVPVAETWLNKLAETWLNKKAVVRVGYSAIVYRIVGGSAMGFLVFWLGLG